MQFTRNELFTITDALLYRKSYIRTEIDKGIYYNVEVGLKEIEDINKLLEKIKEMI